MINNDIRWDRIRHIHHLFLVYYIDLSFSTLAGTAIMFPYNEYFYF